MFACTKIVVSLDLSAKGRLDRQSVGPENESTIQHGVWIARASRARLTFCASGGDKIREPVWVKPEANAEAARAKRSPAWNVLAELVREAESQCVGCDALLLPPGGSEEIVRQVLRGRYDLVVVSNPAPRGLWQKLFTPTAVNLLRQCPGPVWVTRPGTQPQPRQILVASDLTELGEEAMRIAVWLGALANAKIHLVHAADYPLDRKWSTGIEEPWTVAYRQRIRGDAEAKLRQQLERAKPAANGVEPTLHVVDSHSLPDNAILKFIQDNGIDLLVLGMTARAGLDAALMAGMAERLLPDLPCELLAGKPANFVSPVRPN